MRKKLGIGILCLLVVVLAGAGWLTYEKHVKRDVDDRYLETSEKGDVTREEWIKMLTGEYGITQNQKKTPYFSDVTNRIKIFPEYRQLWSGMFCLQIRKRLTEIHMHPDGLLL